MTLRAVSTTDNLVWLKLTSDHIPADLTDKISQILHRLGTRLSKLETSNKDLQKQLEASNNDLQKQLKDLRDENKDLRQAINGVSLNNLSRYET